LTGKEESKSDDEKAFRKFFSLFTLGFLITLLGLAILVVVTVISGGSVNVGGVIFIWFFPIVFGVGPDAAWLILFALILAVLSIIIFLISYRKR
jgi:uncharacterized membrane protein